VEVEKLNKKIKLVLMIVPLLITVSALSGCIAPNAIQTKGWDHANSAGTAVRLWGFLILGENFHNWDGYFVYDIEMHDNWELYANRVEADNYDSFNFFSVDIGNLTRTTEYHYRAVGENTEEGATIRVGVDRTFIPGGPRVWIKEVSDVGIDTAVLEAELTHMGGAASCEVFFRYGTDPDNLDMETPHEELTSTGDFNYEITGLTSCTTYYYRAVAINDADTWDSIYIFQVTPGMPIVETYLPNDVTTDSATYRGELFEIGGPASAEIWFEYSDQNPNNLDETTDPITLTIPGQFSIEVTGLSPDTTYWVRAVANNGICESKGEIKEFKTLAGIGEQYRNINQATLKDRIHSRIKTLVLRGLDILGIPEDAPIELILDSYPRLGQFIQYLE
jgi:hypothetical protein